MPPQLRGLGEIPELGYGFLVTDSIVITSATHRQGFPPFMQAVAATTGAGAQAEFLGAPNVNVPVSAIGCVCSDRSKGSSFC